METTFPFVEIPQKVLPIIGEHDGNTLIYRKEGSQEESAVWFDALTAVIGSSVSPGGVGMYCPVSRAAVYKRIGDGKLSLFLFFVTERKTAFFGGAKIVRTTPYSFIPVSEAKAWRKELEERAISRGKVTREELEGAKPDWHGDFLAWNSRLAKEQARKAKGKKK